MDPLLKVLCILARHPQNRAVILRYGGAGAAIRRLQRLSGKGAQGAQVAVTKRKLALQMLATLLFQ